MYTSSYDNRNRTQDYAESLFDRAWQTGQLKRLLAWLRRRPRQIPLLSDLDLHPNTFPVIDRGQVAVPLRTVVGSIGRNSFDCEFYPLHRRSRDRWSTIAALMIAHPTELPPIRVVEVQGAFYVQDGNHRVSVAKRLNHLYIDALVTLWEVPPEPLLQPATD